MMQYLRALASERQVFISTHSTNFLDTAQMRNVYLVSKDASTRIDLLDREEAEERLPRELGIRLSSIFLFDRLLLVEGPTDEDIIRAWASTMNINFSTANVGFIPHRRRAEYALLRLGIHDILSGKAPSEDSHPN